MSGKEPKTKKDGLIKYSTGKQGQVLIDISKIPAKDYEGVLTELVKQGKNNITSLIISLDTYQTVYPNEFPQNHSAAPKQNARGEPVLLQNSAYKASNKAMQSMRLALKHIFAKTTSLTEIIFRSIFFSSDEMQKLIELIKECPMIKRIYFENVPLYDKDFEIIATLAKKQGIESFGCSACGLTDDSIYTIISIINYHYSVQGNQNYMASLRGGNDTYTKNCISELHFPRNNFSTRALFEIGESISDIPLLLLDLSGNQEMDERMANNIRKNAPHVDLLINNDTINSFERRSKESRQKQRSDSSMSLSEPKIKMSEPLPQEEDELRIPTFALGDFEPEGTDNEVWISKDLKVVGPRAKEFAIYLHALQVSLLKLQGQQEKEERDRQAKQYYMDHHKPLLKDSPKKKKKRAASVTRRTRK